MTWTAFLDMDGTLTDRSEVVPANLDAILRAQARGHRIVLNTGRSYGFIPKKVLDTVPFDGVIAGGGAYVRAGERILKNECVSDEVLAALCDYFSRTDLACYFEGVDECFCMNTEREGFIPIRSYADLSGRTSKITIISARVPSLPDEGRALIERHFTYIQHPHYSEGILRGCSKASGMDVWLADAGLPLSRTVAMGDSANDLEMLAHAAVAAAMGDSTPEVLACADFVSLPCAEGGAALALDRLLP